MSGYHGHQNAVIGYPAWLKKLFSPIIANEPSQTNVFQIRQTQFWGGETIGRFLCNPIAAM
jgi:hypothetical protein